MMKKVLYVFGDEKASGAEIVIERLISYNLKNVEPHLMISPGKFSDDLIASGKPYPIIRVDRLRKLNRSSAGAIDFLFQAIKNYFSISSFVLRYIRKNGIDTIHANTVVPASYLIPAILYSKLFLQKKRWIWSDHDLQYFSKLDTVLSKLCVALYGTTLAVSEAVKKKYGGKRSVSVLYNGLDTTVFTSSAEARAWFRANYGLGDEIVVFGIAATISPRKGQLQLIEVFKELSEKHQNLVLLIAGPIGIDDNDYNAKVTEAISRSNNIKYIGHVRNMIEYYSGCDVIVNNSNAEGSEPLGTTIYEAMACKKIVVASEVGGTPEIITDNVDGFTFLPANSEGLKGKLEYIVHNLPKLDTIKTSARKKVIEKFNLNTMVYTYNNLLVE